MLVDDHVSNLKTFDCNYHPLYSSCVYESIFIWYGIGGPWINAGLPQHIKIDRNPENGYDIHNAADEFSGINIQLNLVQTSSEEDLYSTEEHDGFLHGTKVMINLLQPWVNKPRHIVSADR